MSQVQGRTRWKRFGLVMVPTLAAAAGVGIALSQSALAASFSVSGQNFKVSADQLTADGFSQYGAIDKGQGSAHPVAVSAFDTAKINNLCQSVVLPHLPLVGDVTLRLTAGKKTPVDAKNLYIDLDQLKGDATFSNIDIGTPAGGINKGPKPKKGEMSDPHSFSQQADHAVIKNINQTAWATTAGTFKLSGLGLSVKTGKNECF